MKSEVRLKSEESVNKTVRFSDLKNGEGTIEPDGHLRLRLSDIDYIHFSTASKTVGVDYRDNWPLDLKTKQPIRKFKLIAEEI